MNCKDINVFSRRAVFASISFFCIALLIYFIKFYCSGESNQATWGQLGDFMGGLINPIIGLITIIFLSYNLKQNERLLTQSQEELMLTREELKKGQEIQKATETALKEQIAVAVYGRDLNNALALYENLEGRVKELLKVSSDWKFDPNRLNADMKSNNSALNLAANQYAETIKLKKELNHILEAEHARLLKLYPAK